jgi:pyridoxal phosphate enzyme (YggS family)
VSPEAYSAEDLERLRERFSAQRERLAAAARRAGRDPDGVRLIAVSKTQPAAALRAAYEVGQRDFGENYVQELLAKAEALADLPDVRFHLIGHLQRNKARQVAGVVSAVHSVDSVRLAEELGKRAERARVPETRRWPVGGREVPQLPVLVEVNVGGEASKSGCSPEELEGVLAAVEAEPALRLAGLMTVPPFTEDPAGAAPAFERLVELQRRSGGPLRLPELSMGMSHDAEVAIAAGATLVRIGTALFGPRPART